MALSLLGRSRDERGRGASLSPEGLQAIFDDVPSLLERLQARGEGDEEVASVLRAVRSDLEFHNGTLEGRIARRQEQLADAPEA